MNKNEDEIFIEAKNRILELEEYSSKEKTKAIFNLLTNVIEEVTQDEKIVFTTLFSRVAYLSNKLKLESNFVYYLHLFRRDNERMKIPQNADHYIG